MFQVQLTKDEYIDIIAALDERKAFLFRIGRREEAEKIVALCDNIMAQCMAQYNTAEKGECRPKPNRFSMT